MSTNTRGFESTDEDAPTKWGNLEVGSDGSLINPVTGDPWTDKKKVKAARLPAIDSAQLADDAVTAAKVETGMTPTWTGEHTHDKARVQKEIAKPSAPPSGYVKYYVKSDDNLYIQTPDGTEEQVGGGTDTHTGVSEGGTQILGDVDDINLKGTAVSDVQDDGDGTVTVTLTDTDTDTNTHPSVSEAGTVVLSGPDDINFDGSAVSSVQDDGDGTVTVTLSATDTDTHTSVSDDGTAVVSDVGDINAGTAIAVADDGDGTVTIYIPNGGIGSSQIASSAVTGSELASDAVDSTHIVTDAVGADAIDQTATLTWANDQTFEGDINLATASSLLYPFNPGTTLLTNIPIDSSASSGTEHSTRIAIDGTVAAKFYGEADGSGASQNVMSRFPNGVEIGTGDFGSDGDLRIGEFGSITISDGGIQVTLAEHDGTDLNVFAETDVYFQGANMHFEGARTSIESTVSDFSPFLSNEGEIEVWQDTDGASPQGRFYFEVGSTSYRVDADAGKTFMDLPAFAKAHRNPQPHGPDETTCPHCGTDFGRGDYVAYQINERRTVEVKNRRPGEGLPPVGKTGEYDQVHAIPVCRDCFLNGDPLPAGA